jgi:succinate dehydrogenase / fumarate reductase iron-sulfur subunit
VNLTLHVWRQAGPAARGQFVRYDMRDASADMSFLELLDMLNEQLLARREEPIAYDHDCHEGICGACGVVINGRPHGPQRATTACQLHLRHFADGAELWVEPWRARAFPLIKDLVVDRTAFDRIIQAGGFITARTGSAPEANAIPVPKPAADVAMDAAACIGCGACVAACPNASAMLFVAAKVAHLGRLPQGQPERDTRVLDMVTRMDAEGFGACSNHGECMAACPKEISIDFIAQLNRDYVKATLAPRPHTQEFTGSA